MKFLGSNLIVSAITKGMINGSQVPHHWRGPVFLQKGGRARTSPVTDAISTHAEGPTAD